MWSVECIDVNDFQYIEMDTPLENYMEMIEAYFLLIFR